MTATKKTGTLSKGRTKDTTNTWKAKAIARRKENAKLQKRIKELKKSRSDWKKKYQSSKGSKGKGPTLSGQKAVQHQYDLVFVSLVIALYKYGGMSLRSCRHSLCGMWLSFGLSGRVPSHSSIRNWLCKCGIHRVQQNVSKSGDYVAYVDESISFGSEKLLLILGVPTENIKAGQALSHADMSVLYVGVSTEWKGTQIAERLTALEQCQRIK